MERGEIDFLKKVFKESIPFPKNVTLIQRVWLLGSDSTAGAGLTLSAIYASQGEIGYALFAGFIGVHSLVSSVIGRGIISLEPWTRNP